MSRLGCLPAGVAAFVLACAVLAGVLLSVRVAPDREPLPALTATLRVTETVKVRTTHRVTRTVRVARSYSRPPVSEGKPRQGGGVWDRLAACESGGRWHLNSGNGFSGGLQWMHSTWVAAGGTKYAPTAHQATREQEITVAEAWLKRTSWAQWPTCSRKLGLR